MSNVILQVTNSYRRATTDEDRRLKLFDSDLFNDSTQFLAFFVMAYSSARLGSYLLKGVWDKFRFKLSQKFTGIGVYFCFLLAFVILEFVIFKNNNA